MAEISRSPVSNGSPAIIEHKHKLLRSENIYEIVELVGEGVDGRFQARNTGGGFRLVLKDRLLGQSCSKIRTVRDRKGVQIKT